MKSWFVHAVFYTMVAVAVSGVKGFAQSTHYTTNSGIVRFSSKTPLENIEAENKNGQAILNTSTGEIAVRMTMKNFNFPNKLMQEHFNENYMESEKFPTGTFSGKVETSIDYSRDGLYDVTATGKFTVHGVTKSRSIQGKMNIASGKITITADFQVALSDHKIEVPQIVFVKIAQQIQVQAQFVLMPVNK